MTSSNELLGGPMPSNTAALHGVTVLDFSHVMAGPFATYYLATLGARVIKIENPARGDSMRGKPKSFQAFNDFKIGGLPNLPDPEGIAVEKFLDKLRFQVIRKTDPNLFIMRRTKIFILPKIYSILSHRMKKRVKKVTARRNKLKKFLQE